jgi:uncharacterized LabA/DUF88 family protein
MDRCALFIDAGYLIAEGGSLCLGTKSRAHIQADFDGLVKAISAHITKHCSLPLLRTYWYDGAKDGIPTKDQLDVASLHDVKLRLGRISNGKQKGVDSLIVIDLIRLARERGMATAYLLAGDEDLREGVAEAQSMGVRVVILGIPVMGKNQAETLIRESDENIILPATFWKPHFKATPAPAGALALAAPTATSKPSSRTTTPKPAATLVAPVVPAISTADATAFGESFAKSWATGATHDEVKRLLSKRPSIPNALDSQLLITAEAKLGPLKTDKARRNALRAGFWKTIAAIQAPTK